jgi:hypothetical protein
MEARSTAGPPEVFISYSRRDYDKVVRIAARLEGAGAHIWLDTESISGGSSYGLKISQGIERCKVLLLVCSEASLNSRNVRQEVQLAWRYEKPYLPLLLEPIRLPQQMEYWLEGWQWVEVLQHPPELWLPRVLSALREIGVGVDGTNGPEAGAAGAIAPGRGLSGLRALASFTDRLWPLPAEERRPEAQATSRDLGEDPDAHEYRVGDRVSLALQTDRGGHLLLLDEGPSGKVYCLCPSAFAPRTRVEPGRHYFPQAESPHGSFKITGRLGREHLLAVITQEPLPFDWATANPLAPARVLSEGDIDRLLAELHRLGGDEWCALATYFDVT